MKLKSLLLLALATVLTFAAPRSARALEVSFDFFHDSLSPYGEWIELGDYGYCWRPTDVNEDWTPYSDGYWSYTDAGWTWVSYEEFGGIVYHYGRWTRVEDEGWCWIPDYEWGPAWVSWRKSDDYVGWAPLPAEARWQRDRGFSVWVDSSYDIAPTNYSFCRFRDFGAPVLRPVIIRRSENIVIINHTVNITNITYNNGAECVFNGGLDYGYVNRFSQRQIPALKLVRNTNLTVVNNHIVNNNVRVTNFNSVQRGNQLTVIAPTVVRPERAQVAALLQPKVTKVIPQQKVTKGWGSVPAAERATIRAKFQQEMAGKTPESAPAQPLRTEDLKVVPLKADPKAKLPQIARKLPIALPVPGAEDGKKAPGATTGTPPTNPEAIVKLPPGTPDPAKTTGEKISGRKSGKLAPPPPAIVRENTGNPPAGKEISNPPAAPETMPPVNADPKKTAGEKSLGRKPGKLATPPPNVARETTEIPATERVTATPRPIVKERVNPVRPGIVKPFNPVGDDNQPNGTVRRATTPPPANAAVEKRNAAAEAAREQAAVKEATRQRVMEQNDQQQEIARRNKSQEAAVARQRIQQQQEIKQKQVDPPMVRQRPLPPQEAPVVRKPAVDLQKVEQAQQQQLLRERSAQAAESRQRSLQAQQSQAAAARQQAMENAQAQAAARQKAASIQQQRNVAPPVQQRNLPPAVQSQKVPAKPGKRPLTPEEAAQQQQLLR